MNPEDVRRIVVGWQAAGEREREERRKAGPPDTAAAVQEALEFMDLFGEMHGWPRAENEARCRDDELAWEHWIRVRRFYQAYGNAAKPKDPQGCALYSTFHGQAHPRRPFRSHRRSPASPRRG